jgi:hypothetical protein
MNRTLILLLAALATTAAIAQEATLKPGTYTGSYPTSRDTTITIKLTIKSIEDGVVKGSAYRSSTARSGGQCAGEYPVEGTLKGNELDVSGKATQRDGDCNFRLRAVVDSGRLNAKLGANEFTMR